jgi:hypothetical protein
MTFLLFLAFCSQSSFLRADECKDVCEEHYRDAIEYVEDNFGGFQFHESFNVQIRERILQESDVISELFVSTIGCYKRSMLHSHGLECSLVPSRREWVSDLGKFSGFINGVARGIKKRGVDANYEYTVELEYFKRYLSEVLSYE